LVFGAGELLDDVGGDTGFLVVRLRKVPFVVPPLKKPLLLLLEVVGVEEGDVLLGGLVLRVPLQHPVPPENRLLLRKLQLKQTVHAVLLSLQLVDVE